MQDLDACQVRHALRLAAPLAAGCGARLAQHLPRVRIELRDRRLDLCYDLRETSLAEIESALAGCGIRLSAHPYQRLKRGLIRWEEEVDRANLAEPVRNRQDTTPIYAERYTHHTHGCRDTRPAPWRGYF